MQKKPDELDWISKEFDSITDAEIGKWPHALDPQGHHIVLKFKNGYGLSIVKFQLHRYMTQAKQHVGSIGYLDGCYETAVIKFLSDDIKDYSLALKTPFWNGTIQPLEPYEIGVLSSQVKLISNDDKVVIAHTPKGNHSQ